MTDYTERISKNTVSFLGGVGAVIFATTTMAQFSVLTPLVESLASLLSSSSFVGPFSISLATLVSTFLILSNKGASSLFSEATNEGLDVQFSILMLFTILSTVPSVVQWASGNSIGLFISALSLVLFRELARDSSFISGVTGKAGEVIK